MLKPFSLNPCCEIPLASLEDPFTIHTYEIANPVGYKYLIAFSGEGLYAHHYDRMSECWVVYSSRLREILDIASKTHNCYESNLKSKSMVELVDGSHIYVSCPTVFVKDDEALMLLKLSI